MFLKHVSLNLNHTGVFEPRVPENADFYGENADIPRVCFAPTLEGCLSSTPYGNYNLGEALKETSGVIKVFRVDPTKYGLKCEDMIKPGELYSRGYVSDAWATKEHWILKPIVVLPEDVIYVKVLSFTIECLSRDGLKDPRLYQAGDVDMVTNLVTQIIKSK